ncbi:hypothetical protein RMN57_13185 [Kitasatospora sp. CM 4170]|uniref:Helix-turn-helix domain-containing protein n=1 Tax=Kitasatospora aburaviensis TaxID=67265 RepID=A0ABW1ETZ7_9ACTN|nr:hypothetical protein [Kitasatospora sp. CM 4170]WNM45608.1 hypothetical protein RMN57_13185 [Kitasatospora sp. CM 4170]
MAVYPNPPLDQINPADLADRAGTATAFGVSESTVKRWVMLGLIEALPIPGGPHLYHLPTAALAEHHTWQHGANRPARGGRRPGWQVGQAAA